MKGLIVAGHGVRLCGWVKTFMQAANKCPVVTTWLGADLLPTDHPNNIGIIGPCGQPGANRALHEAEKLVVWGASMSLGQLGAIPPTGLRVEELDIHTRDIEHGWAKREDVPMIGSYALNNAMTRMLPPGTIMVVDGGGTALYTGFQSSYIKEGSRLICSAAMSAMGSGLPEAIGACFANGRRLTTCLIGDGSLMLNLQELQTIATHKLPIKIFVINNGGYLAIRQTQIAFQEGRCYGTGGDDLTFPKVRAIAEAFRLPYTQATDVALLTDGPIICEWKCDRNQPMMRQGFKDGKPLPLTQMVLE